MPYTITFDLKEDFDCLYGTSMRSFYDDPHQQGRFEVVNDKDIKLNPKKKYFMYWVEKNPANMLLGRKMLEASGYEVYALWDMGRGCVSHQPEYCLLTDYPHNWT